MRSRSRVPDLHTMHAREESKGAATRTCVQQHAKGGSSFPLSLLCSKDPREPANTSGSDERLLEREPLPSCLHDRKALCFSRVYGFWIVNARRVFAVRLLFSRVASTPAATHEFPCCDECSLPLSSLSPPTLLLSSSNTIDFISLTTRGREEREPPPLSGRRRLSLQQQQQSRGGGGKQLRLL